MNYKDFDDPLDPKFKPTGKKTTKVTPNPFDSKLYQSVAIEKGTLYKPLIEEVKLEQKLPETKVFIGQNIGPVISYPQMPMQYSVSQSVILPKGFNNFQKLPQKQDYFNKTLENDLYTRTELFGIIPQFSNEFDDYYEKLASTYFTPTLYEVVFFHNDAAILGMTVTYKDAWGKSEKETYKGNVHLPKHLYPGSYETTKMAFDFEDYLMEAYVEGKESVTYIKLVSYKGKKIELGHASGAKLENPIPELTKVIAFGGAYTECLTGLYLYYM